MSHTRAEYARRIVIVGGGLAALEAVLALRDLLTDAEIELVAPEAEYPIRPLSVLAPFALGDTPEVDLERFAREQAVHLRRDTLVSVDASASSIQTGRGDVVPYGVLLVAAGATPLEAVPGAITFRGPEDERRVALLLQELVDGALHRLAFLVPRSAVWSLPLYELALMTAGTLAERGANDTEITLVTPEPSPLHLFGRRASEAVAGLLEGAGIAVRAGTLPRELEHGTLTTVPPDGLRADRAIALPRLVGPGFRGLPGDRDGFIPVDEHSAVTGLSGVYAAGDATTFPLKQGGIATQQADAAAEAIAARLGADLEPEPFRPVLRGMLLTGKRTRYLEADLAAGEGAGEAARAALWWPEGKVLGRYVLPYLTGASAPEDLLAERDDEVIAIEVDAAEAAASAPPAPEDADAR